MTYEWESLEEDPRQDVWSSWPGAVLLDDEIKHYATHSQYPLISPFCEDKLKPARYQLTLGPEARIDGKTVVIDEDRPLIIEPHQVAIVRTYEKLNLPRFLIARWNLRIDMVYRGLLWVGALQVDPGWVGYLPCPLYNMSDSPVKVEYREKVFTIDFVRTSKFHKGANKEYPDKTPSPELNPQIHVYDKDNLRSGPYQAINEVNTIQNNVTAVDKHVQSLNRRMDISTSVIIVVLGVIVAALALLVSAQTLTLTLTVPIAISVVLSIFAIGLSIFAIYRSHSK